MRSNRLPDGVWPSAGRNGFAALSVLILASALFVMLSMVTQLCLRWREMDRRQTEANRAAAAAIVIQSPALPVTTGTP